MRMHHWFLLAAFALSGAAHAERIKDIASVQGVRINQLADRGVLTAKLTRRIMGDMESYLAACQLGITMASLGLGWIGEPAVASLLEPLFRRWGMSEDALHTTSFIIGFLIFSSLHIVIGEQVPKTFDGTICDMKPSARFFPADVPAEPFVDQQHLLCAAPVRRGPVIARRCHDQ